MNTTIYVSRFCMHRDEVRAIADSIGLPVTDANKSRLHSIRCIPCAVVEDERGIITVVEWDENAPTADDLDPNRLDALASERDAAAEAVAQAKALAVDPVAVAIEAVSSAEDLDTVKAAMVAALSALKGR